MKTRERTMLTKLKNITHVYFFPKTIPNEALSKRSQEDPEFFNEVIENLQTT